MDYSDHTFQSSHEGVGEANRHTSMIHCCLDSSGYT